MTASLAVPYRLNSPIIAVSTTTFTATTVARAIVGYAQKTGTIDRLVFYKSSTAGSGTIMGARIETVSGSRPTGTLFSAGASGTVTLGGSAGVVVITFGTPVSVTAGDIIAGVLYVDTYSATPTISVTLNGAIGPIFTAAGLPNNSNNASFSVGSGASWGNGTANTLCGFALLFDDETPVIGSLCALATSTTGTTIPTSGSNSHLGVKFIPDYNCDLHAVQIYGRGDGSIKAEVYNSGNTLIGTSLTLSSGSITNATSTILLPFTTPVSLTSGETYRIVERSVSGASNNQQSIQLYSHAMLEAVYGTGWCRTTSSDGTTWTDDSTGIMPNVMPFVCPTGSGGGGAGMRVHPGLTGGFRS